MQRKKLLKSMCEKAKKKISLAKNINNCYIVNYKIVLMEFLGNMKKMYKENKAITIVGLVIIILVLLIITGITIAILVGNSGIIEQAREAKNNTQKALENENEILEKFISKINKITSENLNENVYLIADSYVKNTALPYARTLNEDGITVATENTPNKFTGDDSNCLNGKQYRAHFFNIVNLYSGMDRILADKTYGNSLKNMNSKYFNAFFERRNNKTK